MYAVIRRYEVSRDIATDVATRSYAELRKSLSERTGFVAYEIVIGDDSLASITIFDTWVSAEDSNVVAADWIKRNVFARNIARPQVTAGEIFEGAERGHAPFAAPERAANPDQDADATPLWALINRLLRRKPQ